MKYDRADKIGIENALDLLEEKLEIARTEKLEEGNVLSGAFRAGLVLGLETGIEIVKMNIRLAINE